MFICKTCSDQADSSCDMRSCEPLFKHLSLPHPARLTQPCFGVLVELHLLRLALQALLPGLLQLEAAFQAARCQLLQQARLPPSGWDSAGRAVWGQM